MEDWVTKAANEIGQEYMREERIAAIITKHAAPLVKLLERSRRNHDECCMPKSFMCLCGADAWNARVDAVLRGDA